MITFSRISAVIARHLIPTFRDPMRITDMLYYPLVDLILFGFLAVWAHVGSLKPDNFITIFLACVACWYLVYRSALEISRNLLMEIWEHHIINLLAGPLSIVEFIFSLMIIGLMQALITFVYSSFVIWLIFSKNIFVLYPLIMLYVPLFIAFGWVIGLLTAALILYFGKNVEFVAWAIPWFFAIISGAYYSLDLFPVWVQKLASFFPGSYLFSGIRETLSTGAISYTIVPASLLVTLYLVLSFMFVLWMFNKSKENGLSNLE